MGNGESYADCVADGEDGIRQDHPYWNGKTMKAPEQNAIEVNGPGARK